MKKVFSLIVLFLLVATNIFAETIVIHETVSDEQAKINAQAFQERLEQDHYLTRRQIKRQHELNIAEKKIEVLARLKEMGSSKVYVHASSGSSVQNKSVQKLDLNLEQKATSTSA